MSKPLLAGELHGLRAWSLESPEGDFLLAGYFGVTWEPGGEPTVAECHANHDWIAEGTHEAPAHDCGCGLYGLHPEPQHAADVFESAPAAHGNAFGDSLQIIGMIEGWGRVELHESGFRAQYARPTLLAVPEGVKGTDYELMVAKLAARYRTELLWYGEPKEVFQLCRERGFGLSPKTVGRLMASPDPEEHSPGQDSPTPSSTSGRRPPTRPPGGRRERLLDFGAGLLQLAGTAVGFLIAAGTAVWFLIAAAISLSMLVAVLAVIAAILGIDLGESSDPVRVAKPNPKLSVIDEEIVSPRGHPLYIATVRNDSRRMSALGVRPVETAFGHIDSRPSLAPGGVGVVLDEPRPSVRKRANGAYSVGMTASMKRGAAPSVRISDSRFDRGLCVIAATVNSSRSLAHLGLITIGRDRRGDYLGWVRYAVGPIPRGSSTQVVDRVSPVGCRSLGDVAVFPELGRGQLAGGKS
ncbi:MAG: hypothetical protein EXQ70_11515 [Solirubrobacterales bacterium]|nr:hypothetical protein [Solirubrobacterales bacterium]